MSKRCCAATCFNSINLNNVVQYFPFPRDLDFAHKWCIAAGRPDLQEKPLSNLTKYYLCSEHFESDCFHDPETRVRLKRTFRPVQVPIPTIFKCNFTDFVPTAAVSMVAPEVVEESIFRVSLSPEAKKRKTEPKARVSLENPKTEVIYPETETWTEIEVIPQEEEVVSAELPPSTAICRLCCSEILPPTDAVELFKDHGAQRALSVVLPGELPTDESLPGVACAQCMAELDTAFKIVTKFRKAQEMFALEEVVEVEGEFET